MGSLFQVMLYKETDSISKNCNGACRNIDERNYVINSQCQNKQDNSYCLQKESCSGRIYKCKSASPSVTACFGVRKKSAKKKF